MWYLTFWADLHFSLVLHFCVANQIFFYFVSNGKIMNNIVLPKAELQCSFSLWQMRTWPLGTVLSQLLLGEKGQYRQQIYGPHSDSRKLLSRKAWLCLSVLNSEAVGQMPFIVLLQLEVIDFASSTERVQETAFGATMLVIDSFEKWVVYLLQQVFFVGLVIMLFLTSNARSFFQRQTPCKVQQSVGRNQPKYLICDLLSGTINTRHFLH